MKDEGKVEQTAQRLGQAAAERLDVEATARAVVARLREPVEERPSWMAPGWLRIAAGVVLLVGGAFLVRGLIPPRVQHEAHFIADDLTDLTADQLREVLNTLDTTLDSSRTTPSEPSLDELDARQLRQVLRSLEG